MNKYTNTLLPEIDEEIESVKAALKEGGEVLNELFFAKELLAPAWKRHPEYTAHEALNWLKLKLESLSI